MIQFSLFGSPVALVFTYFPFCDNQGTVPPSIEAPTFLPNTGPQKRKGSLQAIMLKTFLSISLILLSSVAFLSPALGKNNDKQEQSAARIKRKIDKLGVDTAVIIKLHDGRKLSGRIGEIEDDSFVLRGLYGDRVTISYSEVEQVKNYFRSNSGANLLPGFLIAGGIILLIKLVH
jgi:hypothetical protein